MNSPSPFAAIQAIQEEQREGWMTENKTAMNIETLAGICFNTSRGLAPFEYVEWKDVNDQLRAANIAGMQSALDAYLTSIGEGMPSVEDCRSVAKDGCEAIRNLLLSAFAKKMEAISRLPEKWRIDSGLTGYCSGMQAVKDLEAALGSLPVEPVPEVPADPYAHLKLAWANKRRIRTRRKGSDGWSEWNQPGDVVFYWNLPPECYEIEPLHADKWAAEKAAHAQGKKIEMLISDDEYGPERWSFCELPDWHDRCEYRIAPDPDPAPAGKLTDVQLGEIGAKACNLQGWLSSTHKSNFAAAVREAVEKEQTEEIARLTAELEIFKKIRDSKLELQSKYDDLQVTMDSVTMNANWSIERMKEAEHKLATIEVRLGEIAALPQKWRSRPAVMSWNPAIDCIFELEAALLPRPTAEAVSKADFERFARGEGYSLAKNAKDEFRDTAAIHGWKLWQAARAAKEVKA
jgi:hypothetical protein